MRTSELALSSQLVNTVKYVERFCDGEPQVRDGSNRTDCTSSERGSTGRSRNGDRVVGEVPALWSCLGMA